MIRTITGILFGILLFSISISAVPIANANHLDDQQSAVDENIPEDMKAQQEFSEKWLNLADENEDASNEITEQLAILERAKQNEEQTEGDIAGAQSGGCLIATATYGSELAPQVQMLRELRDNVVLETESGAVFMSGFNQMYYSFSPEIADMERENPILQEVVKVTITPMISSLSILNHLDIDSEAEMLGYGIGIISLNIGMYFVAPVIVIVKIFNRKK